LLGFMLGRLLEENPHQAMAISQGRAWIFIKHRLATVMLATAVLAVIVVLLPGIRQQHDTIFSK